MEKLIVEGEAPIPCHHGVLYGFVVVDVRSIFAAPGGPEPGGALLHALYGSPKAP